MSPHYGSPTALMLGRVGGVYTTGNSSDGVGSVVGDQQLDMLSGLGLEDGPLRSPVDLCDLEKLKFLKEAGMLDRYFKLCDQYYAAIQASSRCVSRVASETASLKSERSWMTTSSKSQRSNKSGEKKKRMALLEKFEKLGLKRGVSPPRQFSADEPGYCYLRTVRESYHATVAAELGTWPTLAQLVNRPSEQLLSHQEMKALRVRLELEKCHIDPAATKGWTFYDVVESLDLSGLSGGFPANFPPRQNIPLGGVGLNMRVGGVPSHPADVALELGVQTDSTRLRSVKFADLDELSRENPVLAIDPGVMDRYQALGFPNIALARHARTRENYVCPIAGHLSDEKIEMLLTKHSQNLYLLDEGMSGETRERFDRVVSRSEGELLANVRPAGVLGHPGDVLETSRGKLKVQLGSFDMRSSPFHGMELYVPPGVQVVNAFSANDIMEPSDWQITRVMESDNHSHASDHGVCEYQRFINNTSNGMRFVLIPEGEVVTGGLTISAPVCVAMSPGSQVSVSQAGKSSALIYDW